MKSNEYTQSNSKILNKLNELDEIYLKTTYKCDINKTNKIISHVNNFQNFKQINIKSKPSINKPSETEI